MSFDLNTVGMPGGGLIMFAGKYAPPDDAAGSAESGEASPPVSTLPAVDQVFKPYARALKAELELRFALRVTDAFKSSEPRRSLGALIDMRV